MSVDLEKLEKKIDSAVDQFIEIILRDVEIALYDNISSVILRSKILKEIIDHVLYQCDHLKKIINYIFNEFKQK